MGTSIINGMFCYDLDCKLIDKTTGIILKDFKSREFGDRNLSVDNVAGGISSLSQNYVIATLELNNINVEPKTHKINIDNQTYAIRNIATTTRVLPYSRKLRTYEKVMYLE